MDGAGRMASLHLQEEGDTGADVAPVRRYPGGAPSARSAVSAVLADGVAGTVGSGGTVGSCIHFRVK